MRVNAYVLAADPTWIEASVLSYYHLVRRIIVSYDQSGRGWKGVCVPVEDTLARLRAIDRDGKMVFVPGEFCDPACDAMDSETRQRQAALDMASDGADWVLQLDGDEVLPHAHRLEEVLESMDHVDLLEWPMRVLFRQLRKDHFLEVCAIGGLDLFEYPGPIGVRSGARLVHARNGSGNRLRLVVRNDCRSPQIVRPPVDSEIRRECLEPGDAIIHNSWARDPRSIRSKISSWGHNRGWRTWAYYYYYWMPAPLTWRFMRNFHPLFPSLWPSLRPYSYELNQAA